MRIGVGDLAFDVLVGGPEDGRPVLLLHGFPETARCWDAVAAALAGAGLRTIAPDQRGYSPGARPPGVEAYRLDHLAADAVGVLDALGVATADVVGHDWGAVVGWHLAAAHPDRVRTLTAVSVPHPAAHGWAIRHDDDQQARSAYIGLFQKQGKAEEVLLEDGGRRMRQMFGGVDPAAVEVHLRTLLEPGALTAALAWYRALLLQDWVRTGPVSVPTTYVWSTGDVAVGRAPAERCAEYVTGPYRMVELPGVSHWIPEEAPEALTEAILDRISTT